MSLPVDALLNPNADFFAADLAALLDETVHSNCHFPLLTSECIEAAAFSDKDT